MRNRRRMREDNVMAASNGAAANRGATRPRAYSISLQQAAAAIFGVSPSSNHGGALPPLPPAQSSETTGKISES
jgi:hypothetical protein